MRTRKNDWIDTETNEKLLGIDVSEDGKNWKHLAIDGRPYFANSEEEREQKRKQLQKE